MGRMRPSTSRLRSSMRSNSFFAEAPEYVRITACMGYLSTLWPSTAHALTSSGLMVGPFLAARNADLPPRQAECTHHFPATSHRFAFLRQRGIILVSQFPSSSVCRKARDELEPGSSEEEKINVPSGSQLVFASNES